MIPILIPILEPSPYPDEDYPPSNKESSVFLMIAGGILALCFLSTFYFYTVVASIPKLFELTISIKTLEAMGLASSILNGIFFFVMIGASIIVRETWSAKFWIPLLVIVLLYILWIPVLIAGLDSQFVEACTAGGHSVMSSYPCYSLRF